MADAADRIRIERSTRHGFAERPASSALDAVRLTTAIQAQDPRACRLGVRARSSTATEADVDRALEVDRSIVRTWLMRATVHLVAATDLRWLTALIGPALPRKFGARWHQLGLTEPLLERAAQALPEILGDGPLSRGAIVAALAERDVSVPDTDPQIPAHVMLNATALGLVCRGPDRGREPTYALVERWVPQTPPGPSGDDALAELARRYFTSYSPATAADFTAWSGLASGAALAMIRDELEPADVAGRPGFRLGEVAPQRGLRLLPAFDNYLIGYRDRTALICEQHRRDVFVGGMIRPVVVHDGYVVGTWRLTRDADRARIDVALYESLGSAATDALHDEVHDIARFIDLPITVVNHDR